MANPDMMAAFLGGQAIKAEKAPARVVKQNLTPVVKPSPSVKQNLTPGEPCPTCGHKVRATAAQYQKAYRARKGKA